MKKNILLKTNLLVCLVIVIGFLLTATLSYRINYSTSIKNIQQVSALTSEGIYYQMNTTFTKPVNISLTMANDSLLKDCLIREKDHLDDPAYIETLREYLRSYQEKYGYDSVFLVSSATSRYYNFNGLDRTLDPADPENTWYFNGLLTSSEEYSINVDNDEVAGAENAITIFVNCKIKDGHGTLLGIVGIGMRINHLQQTLQNYQDEFGMNACLIGEDGTIELSTEYTGYEKVNLFEDDSQGRNIDRDVLNWKEDGSALSFWSLNDAGQKEDYIVVRYLPDINWHLVVERDTGALMRLLSRQLAFTIAIIGVILVVILILITHVIRHFNTQIVRLTQFMERERQAIFEKATEQLFENIYELDITHNCPANRATEQYFESLGAPSGTAFDKVLNMIAEKQIKEEFRQGYLDTFRPESVMRAYEEGKESLHYEFMISKDGLHYYWMRITARIIRWESDGTIHLLVYRQNIDAEKRQEQKMQELAQTDEMTGLLTKTATQRRISQLLADCPGQAFAFFIFDIDNFKLANDLNGHAFGDSVIQTFAKTIREQFYQSDILGRIGGDEFVAFTRDGDPGLAEAKARTLCAALNSTHTWSGMSWHVSSSIGVALTPRDGTDFDTLYRHADTALYETKERHRGSYTLYSAKAEI